MIYQVMLSLLLDAMVLWLSSIAVVLGAGTGLLLLALPALFISMLSRRK
jgi:hypothetical protein